MPSKLFKKGLVVGIIVLFICVGIQPAISSEITIPKISYNEEDCDCNIPAGKLHIVEKIFNKAENYLESKDLIKSDIFPIERPLCIKLESIGILYASLYVKYQELAENTEYGTPEYYAYAQLAIIYMSFTFFIIGLGVMVLCWEAPDWGPDPY